ncbi:juxtaposed with another zinc finger protein 1 [Leptidea sinapis]|uniref:juxtaposed with another zinc finger protein 1 n=1 Tax=Leptidea sinapis TaxID=189913 RepID=UPI0021218048|nr:juxtaposed with another zinc finger protein 1 [Leptidea sinapis]
MAVFMINICKFNGCGITFPRLADLIEHIEDVHIDYDPAVVEQKEASQPACIPLSYVLKFFTEASRREALIAPATDVRKRLLPPPKPPSVRSSTPTGSEMDDEEVMSHSEDSNDSWTNVAEYSSDYILQYGVKMNASASSGALGAAAQEKPFACPVPGCKKRYKNVNGIKYHSKNGHKKDGKVRKAYRCQCGKSYKTAQGLKSHSVMHHVTSVHAATVSAAPEKTPIKMPGLVVTASPAQRQLNVIDNIDANKLVRIYDSIKTKDLPTFTIPKHSLSNINIITANQSQVRHSVVLTTNAAPGSTPLDRYKFDRSPKVTVTVQDSAYVTEMSNAKQPRG